MIADFRFYPYDFRIDECEKEVVEQTKFKSKAEDNQWKLMLEVNEMVKYVYEEYEILERLVHHIESKADIPATLTEVTKTLANL